MKNCKFSKAEKLSFLNERIQSYFNSYYFIELDPANGLFSHCLFQYGLAQYCPWEPVIVTPVTILT